MFDSERLWKDFLTGDVEAYGKIFKYYYSDLYGYGLKLSRKPELVKDCIQDIFIRIGKTRSNLSEVSSIKAYLIVSLRRRLLRKINSQRKELARLDNHAPFPKVQLSPEDLIIDKEINHSCRSKVKEALQSLPDRQKEVLLLRFFNGMTYEEIEQILEINYQSIRNHVYRATKKLRTILAREGVDHRLSSTSLRLVNSNM